MRVAPLRGSISRCLGVGLRFFNFHFTSLFISIARIAMHVDNKVGNRKPEFRSRRVLAVFEFRSERFFLQQLLFSIMSDKGGYSNGPLGFWVRPLQNKDPRRVFRGYNYGRLAGRMWWALGKVKNVLPGKHCSGPAVMS